MKLVTKQICVVVLALCETAACTCEVSLGSPGASDNAPRPTAPAPPTLTQQASAIDPGLSPKPPVPEPTGTLSEASVRKTAARHQNEVKFCMEQDRTPAAKMQVSFLVMPDGAVHDQVEVLEHSDVSDKLRGCWIHALKRWTFEEPKGGPARASLTMKK